MLDERYYLDPRILHLVNESGEVYPSSMGFISNAIEAAEEAAKRLLGCTLVVHNREFILTNLELYYGGIGDVNHDWYRGRFPSKPFHKRFTVASTVQLQKGAKLYVSPIDGNHKRVDIVIGNEGVAVSLLIRNIADKNGKLIGDINGSPNIILREEYLNLSNIDNGQPLDGTSGFFLLDTHMQFVKDPESIETRKRFNGNSYTGFDEGPFGQYDWNFSISNLFIK